MMTVAQLNHAVSTVLEQTFGLVWVRAEISSFTLSAPGHGYMVLKDSQASVKGVIFRSRLVQAGFHPKPGDQVEIQARISIYEPRGDYQLQVEVMRQAGRGALYEQFMLLKAKLQSEGLFDPSHKRSISPYPRAIGVVTSIQAAALHDVLTALNRRAPHIPVVIYPALVQGKEAPVALRRALAVAGARCEVDVLLLVRGGGSLEDLWAFNDESLARDIASSVLPIICGVGHETDFTIADFAADLRAPTPTAAAELACEPRAKLMQQVDGLMESLRRKQDRVLEQKALRLDQAVRRLISPSQRLAQRQEKLALYQQRLHHLFHQRMQAQSHRFDLARSRLQALDPTGVLQRGYAIVTNEQGSVLRDAEKTSDQQNVRIRLAKGQVAARIVK